MEASKEIIDQAGALGASIATLLIAGDRQAAADLIQQGIPTGVDPTMFLTIVSLTLAELAAYTHRTWAIASGADIAAARQVLLTEAVAWREQRR